MSCLTWVSNIPPSNWSNAEPNLTHPSQTSPKIQLKTCLGFSKPVPWVLVARGGAMLNHFSLSTTWVPWQATQAWPQLALCNFMAVIVRGNWNQVPNTGSSNVLYLPCCNLAKRLGSVRLPLTCLHAHTLHTEHVFSPLRQNQPKGMRRHTSALMFFCGAFDIILINTACYNL